jgi:hypothetical protein
MAASSLDDYSSRFGSVVATPDIPLVAPLPATAVARAQLRIE